MVLLVAAVVLAALTPGVVRTLKHSRVNRAANAISAQFYLAQSLAGRQRKPVTVTVSTATRTIVIADAVSRDTLAMTSFGLDSDFKLAALSATPPVVYLLPSGLANASIVVDVGDASYRQQVRMTRAGQVRILR